MENNQLKNQILDLLLKSSLIEDIENKLWATPLSLDPYPYLHIEHLFPEDFYEFALAHWPDYSFFKQKNNDRQFLWINYGCLNQTNLPNPQKIFWQTFGEILLNRYIKPILIKRFLPHISIKFNETDPDKLDEIMKNLHFWDHRQDALISYPANRVLKPHLDESNIFIQILSYFPEDNDHAELGTSLYQGPPTPTLKVKEIEEKELKRIKKIPYKRGNFLAFLNSPISWHSVDSFANDDQEYLRKVYMGSVSLTPESIQKVSKSKLPFSAYDLYFHELLLQEI